MSLLNLIKKAPCSRAPEWIIAGLGNPGAKYAGTRHNAGFMALDRISESNDIPVKNLKFKALSATGLINGTPVLLIKPQTFMNLSGESVREAASFYKIPPERILVIFDDLSLDTGRLRIKRDGSDGGHNGIKNIIYNLSSDKFPRIKIGIGSPQNPEYDIKDWVTGKLSGADALAVREAASKAAEAVSEILRSGLDSAMNKFNSR
ncbi:MAG: aminoacyl-tRNA hydrolase [Bacillota bacterium]|nr:aminoacyl-tRNA hydrolase [Bacillota bacterium]